MFAHAVRICILIPCLLLCSQARAVVYCVNSASSIAAAFNSANLAANGSTHDIRVRTGSYSFTDLLNFGNGEDKEFSFTGGWNSDCSTRTINPANTTLSLAGQSTSGKQFVFGGNQRSFRIEGIRFQNFYNFTLFESICPFGQSCADTESVRVRHNHFRQGLHVTIIANDAQTYIVSNNLFEDMNGTAGTSASATVSLGYANEDSIPQVSFNTFSLECNEAKPALRLHSEKEGARFSHNILATSGCASHLHVDSTFNGKAWQFRNNLYPAVNTGTLPGAGSGGNLIGVNPQFMGATDFRLRETAPVSPAINAGLTQVQAGQNGLSVPAQDLDGPSGARLVGSRYDMGAYESAISDAGTITVVNTSDSGAGSLRAAINSANATPGLQKIQFNIPGNCSATPHFISLLTPLPDITDSVEIDGYSEPQSAPNTLTTGSDAVLCIIILAQSGVLAQALQVPDSAPASTSLVLKGIAFAGATGFNGNFSVALRLRGGSDHLVQGNAFGGVAPGDLGPIGELTFGIQIRNSAQNATIGGSEPEHRNSFGAMSSSAIVLNDASSGGHTIQNNYIGLSASGLSASPIQLNGIFASASPNVRILDNVISAVPNNAAISITGASATGYEIARNKLGTSAGGVPTAAFRNATGISITNGSGGHQIGGILNSSVSNTITNSQGAGVLISSSAGNGTSVRPNRIFSNGVDGVSLGIDLGAPGALPNDAGDADGGPNNGQNTPVISASTPNQDGTRQVSGTLATQSGSYIIDIYRAPDCPGGRGNMLNLVATEFVTNVIGLVGFSATVPGSPLGQLTAVATRIATGDSSEVSACFQEKHETSTTIFSDNPDPSPFGSFYQVVVRVSSPSGGIPTGTVAVTSPGTSGCQATLSAAGAFAQGSCQLPSQAAGGVTVTASYPGNATFLPSSDTESHTSTAASTLTTIVGDAPDPSELGQPYTVAVQVLRQHDGAAVESGMVSVSDGAGQTCQIATLSAGGGTCELTSVTPGPKTLTASFTGVSGQLLASNDTEPHSVAPATTTTTITSDQPDPSLVGQPYTVSVAVGAGIGAGTPVGTVSIDDGSGDAGCVAPLVDGSGSCQLVSSSPGIKTLTATYQPGSPNFASSSDTEAHTVNSASAAATSTTITSHAPQPSRVGQPIQVGVTVVSDAGIVMGTVGIGIGDNGPACEAVLENGSGSCMVAATSAGTVLLNACMQPDDSFGSSCDSTSHQVDPAATAINSFDFDPSMPAVGESVTILVGVDVLAPGAGAPTGQINVHASADEQCTITLPAVSCQLAFLSSGTRSFTVDYSGDANFLPSDGQGQIPVAPDTLFRDGFE